MTTAADELTGLSATLFARAGIAGDPVGIYPLPGGSNNRVVRVEAANGESFLLKTYLANPGDDRDRCGTEWKFSSFLWNRGERCIAEPLARDPPRASLFRFIHGNAVTTASVAPSQLQKAGQFVRRINRWRDEGWKTSLGSASEACFSLSEHLECIEQRLHRLQGIAADVAIQREARLFVDRHLVRAWQRIVKNVVSRSHLASARLDVTLSPEERCLSPSDFGFHNALQDNLGTVYWLDFEYAGWDDPAKLICDFFCQPHIPVHIMHWDFFLGACGWPEKERQRIEQRARLLFPVYRIKWCCILLNEFLPIGAARRGFARGANSGADLRPLQLAKARSALNACVSGEVEHGLY